MEPGVFTVEPGASIGGREYLFYCTINGVLKLNIDPSDRRVANEFICSRLAVLLGLPVPSGAIIKTKDGRIGYATLRFGSERPPPVIPKHLVEDHPNLAVGIVVFDCWVATPDRHARNLAYSRKAKQAPVVFDHDQSLLGLSENLDRLTQTMEEAFVSSCLQDYITQGANFKPWVERVEAIRNDILQEICEAAVSAGALDAPTGQRVLYFLTRRRDRIRALLQNAKEAGLLPKLKELFL